MSSSYRPLTKDEAMKEVLLRIDRKELPLDLAPDVYRELTTKSWRVKDTSERVTP